LRYVLFHRLGKDVRPSSSVGFKEGDALFAASTSLSVRRAGPKARPFSKNWFSQR
jgi:hypothetical protein